MVQYRTKKASFPKCPITGQRLAGIKALRPSEYSNKRMSKRQKSVNRIYGGCLSHGVVRERIVRAFLLEEQKIVKKVRPGLAGTKQRRAPERESAACRFQRSQRSVSCAVSRGQLCG